MDSGSGAAETMSREEVMRTFVRGRLGMKPELDRSSAGVAVCRMTVVGKAAGPASRPPKVVLYLTGEEAEKCGLRLNEGDTIQAVGDIGPERPGAELQEVLVTERVKLRKRAGGSAGAA